MTNKEIYIFVKKLDDKLNRVIIDQEKRLTVLETTVKNIWYAFLFISTVLTLIVGFLALKS